MRARYPSAATSIVPPGPQDSGLAKAPSELLNTGSGPSPASAAARAGPGGVHSTLASAMAAPDARSTTRPGHASARDG